MWELVLDNLIAKEGDLKFTSSVVKTDWLLQVENILMQA